MPKKTVTEAAPVADTKPEAPPRNGKGQFQPLRGLPVKGDADPPAEATSDDPVRVEPPPGTYKDFLEKAKAAGIRGGDEPAPDPEKPGNTEDQPDDEAEETPAAAEAKPEEAQTDVTKYLTKEQRAELTTRLDQGKSQRAEQKRIAELDQELQAAKRQLASGTLDDWLKARGLTREAHLENLMLGRDQQVEQGTQVDPHVAALKAELDAVKAERAAEKAAYQRQQEEQVNAQAVTRLQGMVTKASGFTMIAALKQHGRLLARLNESFDGSVDIGQVTQVEAARLEDELREAYPDVAAVLASGGTASEARAAAEDPLPPVTAAAALSGKKPAVGNRGGKAKEAHDPLSLDETERHAQVKRMFGWTR